MTRDDGPPAPSRVRLVRPSFYRSQATGGLAPDLRDLLVGLATMADDEGWLVWRPAEIAATLYPYGAPARRLRDLDRRVTALVAAELLVRHDCGCTFLPTLKEHHAVKGGVQSSAVWAWHHRHTEPLPDPLRSDTDISVSGSVSGRGSSSSSVSDQGSFSSRVRDGAPAAALCTECRRPAGIHLPGCEIAKRPFLEAVRL